MGCINIEMAVSRCKLEMLKVQFFCVMGFVYPQKGVTGAYLLRERRSLDPVKIPWSKVVLFRCVPLGGWK